MKKKISPKEIIIPAVSLFVICLVVTALLAVTNKFTQPRIEKLAADTENKTKAEVLSSADSFSEAQTYELQGVQYEYYEGLASGEKAGYVISTSAKGYGGDIDVMVGIGNDGRVTGVSILSISETAGLGMNAKNDSFLSQFNGLSGEIGVAKNNAKDNDIQALTGATITSKAMVQAVNTALQIYSGIGGEQNG